jgi:phosphatidylglycerophosphate synthase
MKYNLLKIFEITIVNLITIFRLIGAVILPFIYFNKGTDTTAIWIICLFLTDAVDGFLARILKVSTFFGSSMDALSDKILNAIAFIILGFEYRIMIPPLILEIAIMLTIYSTYRFGGNIQSSRIGKTKTIVLDVCVVLSFILLSLDAFELKGIIIGYIIKNTNGFIGLFGYNQCYFINNNFNRLQ